MVVSPEGQVSSPEELIAILGKTLYFIGPWAPPPPPSYKGKGKQAQKPNKLLRAGDRRRPRDI